MAYHFDSESQKLSEKETRDPYLVLLNFFEDKKLPRIRELLGSWFRAGMTGIQLENLNDSEKAELFEFFNQVERLIEAADLINRRSNQLEL